MRVHLSMTKKQMHFAVIHLGLAQERLIFFFFFFFFLMMSEKKEPVVSCSLKEDDISPVSSQCDPTRQNGRSLPDFWACLSHLGNSDKPVSSICPNHISVGRGGFWNVVGNITHTQVAHWEDEPIQEQRCVALHLQHRRSLTLVLTLTC